jgi:hypothetical protein
VTLWRHAGVGRFPTRNQFVEVNRVVPALVQHVDSMPKELYKNYVFALLAQARSESYEGAPAARRALSTLPEAVAKDCIEAIDIEFLDWNSRYDDVKEFAKRYNHLDNAKQKGILQDLLKLLRRDFAETLLPDSSNSAYAMAMAAITHA